MLLGNVLRGIGETPVQPLGISYIDDFATEENAALYVGKNRSYSVPNNMLTCRDCRGAQNKSDAHLGQIYMRDTYCMREPFKFDNSPHMKSQTMPHSEHITVSLHSMPAESFAKHHGNVLLQYEQGGKSLWCPTRVDYEHY